MPLYEYICDSCDKTTEALRPMAEADKPIPCEHCGGKKTHRTHSVFAASTGSNDSGDLSLPMGGCGMCGDPNGPCSMN